MALILSQALHYITSRDNFSSGDEEDDDKAHALPFIASPVDPKAYAWLHHKKLTDPLVPGKVRRSRTVQEFEADQGTDSALAGTIFRKQHEASTLELFFDLFFVGNLAVFTDIHAHVDAQSVANYIGFFSILWTTWFHVSIFDVRFYTDCMLSRFFKIVCFGVMTSFVGLGPVYETIMSGGETRAFTGLALVLMVLRFMLTIQYGIVLYFVRGFHKTLIPLVLTMAIYAAAGIAFLITYLVDRGTPELNGIQGASHIAAWYIILGIEIAGVMVVSSVWRILSFKHTHLVERVGLLTLIVMGEGILGLTKSLAYDVMGRNVSIWEDAGLIISAVILIYFIYVLYFNNISHDHEKDDRWGSIRQQIWAVLHYCLHVAILLTVEGQTALIIWNASRTGCMWFKSIFPNIRYPGLQYNSTASLVAATNASINSAATQFHYYTLSDYYNQTSDLEELQNIPSEYGSTEWNTTASEILERMRFQVQYFIFVNFQAEGPKEIEESSDPEEKVNLYNESFQVVTEYFYIGAGGFLLILAVMYWFGSRARLRKDEWASIVIRLVVGIGLPFVSIVAFTERPNDTTGFRYQEPWWLIPIVMFAFLAVLMADNLVKVAIAVFRRHRRKSSASTLADEETAAAADREIHERKEKQVQFADQEIPQQGSHDSDTTLEDVDTEGSGAARGYSHVNQNDYTEGHGAQHDHVEGHEPQRTPERH